MKQIKFLLSIGFLCCKVFSQDITTIENKLKQKYPEKANFVADGVWVFHPETGDVKKLSLQYSNKLTPQLKYFTASLTYYLDMHIEDAECIILFNKKDSSITLVPPVWFHGIDDNLVKLWTGSEFKNNSEIQNFVKEFEKVILIGSAMHLGETSYQKDKTIIRLILNNHVDTWSTITLNFKENKLISIESNKE